MTVRHDLRVEDIAFFLDHLARTDPKLRQRQRLQLVLTVAIYIVFAVALGLMRVWATLIYAAVMTPYLLALPYLRRRGYLKEAARGPNRDMVGPHALAVDTRGVTDEIRGRVEFIPWGEVTKLELVSGRGLILYGTLRGLIVPAATVQGGGFDAFWAEAQALWTASRTQAPATFEG